MNDTKELFEKLEHGNLRSRQTVRNMGLQMAEGSANHQILHNEYVNIDADQVYLSELKDHVENLERLARLAYIILIGSRSGHSCVPTCPHDNTNSKWGWWCDTCFIAFEGALEELGFTSVVNLPQVEVDALWTEDLEELYKRWSD